MDVAAKLTSKGQVTLPKPVRDALGLDTGDEILFRVHKGRAILAKIPSLLDLASSVPVPPEVKGKPWSKIRSEAWKKATERHR